MKGRMIKIEGKWHINYNDADGMIKFIPLSQDDVNQIEADAKIFDNIEARISASPDCEFEIITIDNGDNGVRYAKLKQSEYPELEGTMNLCNDIIKRTGKMTEEEWLAAERAQAKQEQKGILVELMELDSKDGLYESVTISSPQYIPEISDEEIEKAGWDYELNQIGDGYEHHFIEGAKWYREQLKKKQ